MTGEYGIGYTYNTNVDGDNFFYFDLQDYQKIKDYCWGFNSNWYLVATTNDNKKIRLQRLVMECPNGMVVDHINHDIKDNRKINLRITTGIENSWNRRNTNRYGKNGICFDYKSNRYRAFIQENNKYHGLGRYNNKEDAVAARKDAEEKYFGEYSYDNSVGVQRKDEE